jgi:hypothetical protein
VRLPEHKPARYQSQDGGTPGPETESEQLHAAHVVDGGRYGHCRVREPVVVESTHTDVDQLLQQPPAMLAAEQANRCRWEHHRPLTGRAVWPSHWLRPAIVRDFSKDSKTPFLTC